jgi:hypothetical protein
MRARLALTSWAFVATASTVVAADERPVLVVDATADGRAAAVVERLNAVLGPEPKLGPIAPDLIDALSRPTPTDDLSRDIGANALALAREHLGRFAYGDALAVTRAAEDALAGNAGDWATRTMLADLVFAEANAIAGETHSLAAAAATMTLVHRLAPGRTLDPAHYPPDQVAAFRAAATPPTGSGAVMVAAPGATEILIDGESIGPEPALAQLSPGPHVVSARGGDIVAVGRRVVAAAGQTVRVDLIPVLAPVATRAARARDQLRAAGDDATQFAALAALLTISATRDAIVLVSVDGQLATRIYTARGGLGKPSPLEDDLGAVVRPLRPLAPSKPRPIIAPPPPIVIVPPELPWYEHRWAKLSLGFGGAAVAITAIAIIANRGRGTSAIAASVDVD